MKEETLLAIEECGRYQFDVAATSIITEIPEEDLSTGLNDSSSVIYKRYNKGKMEAEFQVRKAIYNLAIQGSSQAQELFLLFIKKNKLREA